MLRQEKMQWLWILFIDFPMVSLAFFLIKARANIQVVKPLKTRWTIINLLPIKKITYSNTYTPILLSQVLSMNFFLLNNSHLCQVDIKQASIDSELKKYYIPNYYAKRLTNFWGHFHSNYILSFYVTWAFAHTLSVICTIGSKNFQFFSSYWLLSIY